MGAVEGVINVHDLHVWSLGSNYRALACHVTIADIPPSESACILVNLNQVLRDRFQISHTTIQFEHAGCHVLDGCVVPMEEMAGSQGQSRQSHVH
jgi:cobalt-zinc-cadmium efflux system protein